MSKEGLAEAPVTTTPAPGMYEEIEQGDDVARGCVKVVELIAYDKFGEKVNDVGKVTILENSRKPVFCQTKEQELIYNKNNPDARIESFSIQLLKSTAIDKMNSLDNMKKFISRGDDHART